MFHDRRRPPRRRRGVVLVESALTYPIVLMLTLGTIVLSTGVFRYQELAWLAREGARWAAVHGPTYQSEQGQPAPTAATVMSNAITPNAVMLTPASLTCTLSMTSGVATVTLTYSWTPEAYFSSGSLTSKASMPIVY